MDTIEQVLDDFIEGLFRLMLEHHQAQVLEMDLTVVQAQALKLLRTAPLPASKLAAALGDLGSGNDPADRPPGPKKPNRAPDRKYR